MQITTGPRDSTSDAESEEIRARPWRAICRLKFIIMVAKLWRRPKCSWGHMDKNTAHACNGILVSKF